MKDKFSFSMARYRVGVLIILVALMMPLGIASSMPTYTAMTGETLNEFEFASTDTILDDSKLDGYLNEMILTNKMLDGINYVNGKMSIQMLVVDDPTIGGKIEPITVSKLSEGVYYVHATVDDLAEIEMLEAEETVLKIGVDRYYGPDLSGVGDTKDSFQLDVEDEMFMSKEEIMDADLVVPHSVETREILGVNDVNALGYNGSGVLVNVHDTGVDFGHTTLRDSMAVDEFGYPLSFEPMGRMSITSLWSLDYWMDIYNDPCGNPEGYSAGTAALLDSWFSPRHTDADGYISLAGYGNLKVFAADLGSLYSLYQLWMEVPSMYYVGDLVGNDTGFAFGMSVIHNDGWIQFVPFLEADEDGDGDYDTLYVDYASGWALTMWWWTEDPMYWDMAPFDFSTAIATKNNENLALSADVWDGVDFGVSDGYYDISMGSIGNVYDYNELTDYDVLLGIPGDGKSLGHIWDVGGHGTGCSGYVAADWTDYQLLADPNEWDYPSDEYFTIGGMAPESKIVATAGFSDTATNLGWQWACGFDYNPVSGYWEFNNESTHIVSISSNSWGTSAVMDANGIAMGWDFTTMFIDYLSAPGYLHEDYPGVLFLTSTGNGGSGMGTSKQPSQSTAAVAVGASTVNWWRYATGYGDENTTQGNDQVIGWSDNGPAVNGYPKIDILAPGAFDFSLTPVSPGGVTFTTVFGGTSASCPVVAGSMAVLYQAWEIAYPGVPLTPDMAKVIMKSTAEDIGYDPYMQGTGRIDVAAMVDFVNGVGEELIGYSFDAPALTVDRTWYNFYYYYFGELPPLAVQNIADNAIYGGALFAGDSIVNDLYIEGNTTDLDYEAVTFETTYEAVNSSVDLHTSEYYSKFALADLFDITQLQSADYFQLILAMNFDEAMDYRNEFGRNPPYMYVTSLESGTFGAGDEEYAFWNYGYDNNNFQDLFLPTNFIQDGMSDVYIQVRDYVFYNESAYYNENWTGIDFTLSVRAFTRTVDPQISLEDFGDGEFNVTITVDGAAVPGNYEGYIIFNSTVDNHMLVPYGYSVAAFVEEYNVDGWTYLSDGTFTGRPNDNGLYGCADWNWRPETGDWRYYDFVVENSSAMNTIVLELEWENPGSEMNMWLMDNDGWIIDYTDYLTNGGQYISEINAPDTMQRLVIGLPWVTDLWTVIVHSTTLAPTVDTVPLEAFILKVSYLNDTADVFAEPTVAISVPGDVETSNGVMVTDELYSVQWDVVTGNPIPEFTNDGYNNTISITSAMIVEETQTLAADDLMPYTGSIRPEYTKMVYLYAGDFVSGTLDWSDSSDFDFLLIHAGDPYDFDSCIFDAAAATGSKPEHFEGYIPEDGLYEIVVEWFDGPGTDVEFNMFFAVLYDEVYYDSVLPGDLMEVNMTDLGVNEGTYLVTTTSSGWNFDHTINTRFIYDIGAPIVDVESAVGAYQEWNEFSFTVDEASEGFYEVWNEDCLLAEGEVGGFEFVYFEFFGWAMGDFTFDIYVEDMFGYNTTTTMDVFINYWPEFDYILVDETGFVFAPYDLDMLEGEYEVYVDGVLNLTGAVADAEEIYVNTTAWAEGAYYVEIAIFDEYGYGIVTEFDVLIIAGPETTVIETVTEPCPDDDTDDTPTDDTPTDDTSTDDENGGGIPGYATGAMIIASFAAAAFLFSKKRK
ncbi:MAG: S8 family serine peptidase [Promethearchaeota archaeon]